MAGRRPSFAEVDETHVEPPPVVELGLEPAVQEQSVDDNGEGTTIYPSLRKRNRTQAFVVSHLPSHVAEHSLTTSYSDTFFPPHAQKQISLARAQTFADAFCSPTASSSAHFIPSSSNTVPLSLKTKRKTPCAKESFFALLDPDLCIPEVVDLRIAEDEVDKAATQSDSSHAHLLKEQVRKSSSKRASLGEALEQRRKVSLHEKLKSVPVPIAERKALWKNEGRMGG